MTQLALLPWPQARPLAEQVRRAVFIEEQQIPESEEWDDVDDVAIHAVLSSPQGQPLATGRVWVEPKHAQLAHIGRMAVCLSARQQGLGRQVLQALMQQARRQGCTQVSLHAQTSAQAFYAAEGFEPVGEVFDEVGIPHITMVCTLI
jgi:predicted GNAT family N-acyltransferase